MGNWFTNESTIEIANDLDLHDIIHYGLIFGLVLVLTIYHYVSRCKRMKRELAALRASRMNI